MLKRLDKKSLFKSISKPQLIYFNQNRNFTIGGSQNEETPNEFDYIVIGGGSGGLACSKRLSIETPLNTKICLIDYRDPTNHWLEQNEFRKWIWGLGGTCTNVGCIPKKLMHTSALLGETIKHDISHYGWKIDSISHDWSTLVQNVQNHIRSINFGYRIDMTQTFAKDNEIKKLFYLNMKAKFINDKTIELFDPKKNVKKTISGKNIILAIGGKPRLPDDIPGAKEYAITSDDLFSLKNPPGKTLIIGAGYIALESASFLNGIGYEATVMMRSSPLRGFDKDCSFKLIEGMKDRGVNFIEKSVLKKIIKLNDKEYQVEYINLETKEIRVDTFNTVMFAIGREALTKELGLSSLQLDKEGKVVVNEKDQSISHPHIYAIGDCINRKFELTPVAIKAGSLLAKRLCNSECDEIMDYDNIPTSVFTSPYEYGCVGLSEEEAISRYGEDKIEIYITQFTPLEVAFAHRDENKTFMKLVCLKKDNGDEQVIGFHYVGNHAGEITQGVSIALKMGATKKDFERTVGIHPTIAEEMCQITVTKRSGKDPNKRGC
ncbi:hypothetical protein ABK040_007860 [Willaertia magna]